MSAQVAEKPGAPDLESLLAAFQPDECDIPETSPLRSKAAHYIRLGRTDLSEKSVTLLAGAA